jgi:hypothetical protein
MKGMSFKEKRKLLVAGSHVLVPAYLLWLL